MKRRIWGNFFDYYMDMFFFTSLKKEIQFFFSRGKYIKFEIEHENVGKCNGKYVGENFVVLVGNSTLNSRKLIPRMCLTKSFSFDRKLF